MFRRRLEVISLLVVAFLAGACGDSLEVQTSGTLRISTATAGTDPDPDGYTLQVDAASAQPIGSSATLLIEGVASGSHTLQLAAVPGNCAVAGNNPRTIDVAAGRTTIVTFDVSCSIGTSSWIPMPSGTTMFLEHLSGTSASNVFAAGEDLSCDISCGIMTILHFDGAKWSTQLTEAGYVLDIWAASATDAFALAGNSLPPPISRYDGAQWSTMDPQPPPPDGKWDDWAFEALWGSSAADVFAVGSVAFSGATGPSWRGYIVHYNGANWFEMPIPDGLWLDLHDVWGSSATDVFAVASYQPRSLGLAAYQAVILHYDGHGWSEVLREPSLDLYHVSGSSPSDVYATGHTLIPSGQCNGCADAGPGAIWHFDGIRWSALPSPTPATLGAIWGSSAQEVYVLAEGEVTQDASGIIWHFDGSRWERIDTGPKGLLDIWGNSAGPALAVGANGTILHGP